MGLTLRRLLVTTTLLLILCLAVSWASSLPKHLQGKKEEYAREEMCPPCEMLFSKLEPTGSDGKLSQFVKVQERGEPKSGTGFMYFWATATLMKTCDYLQELYGEESCRVELNPGTEVDGVKVDRTFNRTMIFEPALGGSDSKCFCDTIDRVTLVITAKAKHTLPVDATCAYSHKGGIDLAIVDRYIGKTACTFADGSKVENKDDLWRCMHKASCDINDDWIQMAVFRDPRPAIVSSYFHIEVHGGRRLGTLEDFVNRNLPLLCQWLALRYMLFRGMLNHRSMEFWYDDVVADPLLFHYHWFYSIGVQLPPHVVQSMTRAAVADNLGFGHKDVDVHRGEKVSNHTGGRRFEDEVSPELVETANAVLRVWLPGVLLDKLGIMP